VSKKIYVENQSPQPIQENRVYREQVVIETDVFKTTIGMMNKNIGTDRSPRLEPTEHVHFFRTYDSDGKKYTKTNSVGGHYHLVELEEQEEGPVKILSVSGPMRDIKVKDRKKGLVIQSAPIHEDLEDTHTHDLVYLESQKIGARIKTAAAAQFVGQEAMKTAKIPGVIG